MFLLSLISCIILFALYKTVNSITSQRRHRAEAERLGCKPPQLVSNSLPFGIDHVLRFLKADSEKRFPDMMVERVAEQGRSTFQTNLLGLETLLTTDPKNIQALLATQFQDFCLGKDRRGNFFPLLGNGIFTQDGKGW